MTKILAVLIIALVFESIGVVLLSRGLKNLGKPTSYGPSEIVRLIGRGAQNPNIVLGVVFEALFFAGLLYLMTQGDLSFVWPMTSLSFVFSTLAARYILHENVTVLRWSGVILIMCGAALITWTEKHKEQSVVLERDPGAQNLP